MSKLKLLSTVLCAATLVVAGCSCDKKDDTVKANINNGTEVIASGLSNDAKNYTLQEIYDDLKANGANETSADKLLEIVADSILTDEKWQARYNEKIEEKMEALTTDASYQSNELFDEEKFVMELRKKLYTVTCENNNYGPTYKTSAQYGNNVVVDKYFLCDYQDYINKEIKVDVLTELLNEKYIYDKVMVDKPNLLTTNKVRLVEYISISNEKDYSLDFIKDAVTSIAAPSSTIGLKEIRDLWINKQVEGINTEYQKINTSEDKSGSIMQDYTGGYVHYKEEGLRIKMKAIYDSKYYDEVVITNKSNSILNTTLIEKILNENVMSETAKHTIEINDNFYLVSPLAGVNISSNDIRITDTTNKLYYLVRVEVINSESSEDMIYEAVKVLASTGDLVGNSINYYLEQNKNSISIHDEEIYTYLKSQYSDIFVD